MSEVDPNIMNFNTVEPAEDSPQSDFNNNFDYNIGVATGPGKLQSFQSGNSLFKIPLRITESIPTNKGRFCNLQYPCEPDYTEKVEGGRVAVTDLEKRQAIFSAWCQGWVRIMDCFGLDKSATPEQLKDAIFISTWAGKVEGKQLVFGASEYNGFITVKAFRRADGKMAVVMRTADSIAKNAKGQEIPGLTALEQARQKIQEYVSRGK